MATKPKTDQPDTPKTTADPVSPPVAPVPVEVLDIPKDEPYPTGDPKTPQTWAEINGLVPTGTGPLAPAEPPATGE